MLAHRLDIRRCTSKHGDEPIAVPKLNVVLAIDLFGSTPAACSSMQSSFAAQITCLLLSTTNTLYRIMEVPSSRGPAS